MYSEYIMLQDIDGSAQFLKPTNVLFFSTHVSCLQNELRLGVHGRFMDQAASVREAAVDLVGRFVLDKPQLTLQYYPMLSERILDKGIGVRYVPFAVSRQNY